MKNNIIFYGPIGNKQGTIIGGGESGNKKTISLLKKMGFNIVIIRKPYPLKVPFLSYLYYPIQLFVAYFTFLFKTLTTQKPTFHLSGFYNHLIYFEWLFIASSKLLGMQSTYEIRAGGAIEAYKERSSIYKLFFRATLKSANSVICQGKEYLPFVFEITKRQALYYPNFIEDAFIQPYVINSRDRTEISKIVYFGRISASKNIDFILDICIILAKAGLKYELQLIGTGDREYLAYLNKIVEANNLKKNVIFSGSMSPDSLRHLLWDKHFFVFPTKEKREGHSNSLTEAMSRGVVPIVSNYGFNSSIVNNDDLILSKFDPEIYANKIQEIWLKESWLTLSRQGFENVNALYTEDAVRETLTLSHGETDK